MSVAIYFGKVNLISSQIYDVYEQRLTLRNILSDTMSAMSENVIYAHRIFEKIDDELVPVDIEYSISIKEKNASYVTGFLHKRSFIHYKDFDKNRKEVVRRKIENIESSEFYYDVYREMIGYQRTIRFGYKEFLMAFEGLLNQSCKLAGLNYAFSVTQFTEALDLNNLRAHLHAQENIQELKIKYQVPNPDVDTLIQIQLDPEKTLNQFKDANLSSKSVTYNASPDSFLNISSELIEMELLNIDTIHKSVDSEKALQTGYVIVETTDINGVMQSTQTARPLIKHISDIANLQEAANSVILNHYKNSYYDNNY